MGFFSPDGQCYSFDERANGYAKGEGAGVIVLKLLSDALKNGDTIRAVIRASGANQDGRTPGITQPSKLAQEQNIRETYRLGGLDLNTTQYFEAHGTGTQVGDPIEAEAISAAFQRTGHNPLLIGALKPNIGHLESASGIASLMKTVLVLENGLIPPNIGFNRANVRILTHDWHIKVCLTFLLRRSIAHPRHKFPVEPTSWPTKGLRRASVNSFGYGGSNTHIVLDDAFNYLKLRCLEGKHCTASLPPLYAMPGVDNAGMSPHGTIAKINGTVTINSHPLSTPKTQPQVFLLSAFDEEGVRRLATAYREFLESKSLPAREDQNELQKPQDQSNIDDPEIAQPVCTAVQIALVDLLSSWGIAPRAVTGHSSGEIAAAYCLGSLSHESAIKVAFYRGFLAACLAKSDANPGAMLSVALSKEAIAPYIEVANTAFEGESVNIGCVNSPMNVTITGSQSCIDALSTLMDEKGIFARKLKVNIAYHSIYMQKIADEYFRLIQDINDNTTSHKISNVPVVFSTVTGVRMAAGELAVANHWVTNLVSTVQFSEALQSMADYLQSQRADNKNANDILLEIGPTSALQRPVTDTLKSTGRSEGFDYDATLKRGTSGLLSCLELAGRLHIKGYQIDLMQVNCPDTPRSNFRLLTNLPSYPFNHFQSYWAESRISSNFRLRKHARHELLGAPVADWNPLRPRWRNIVRMTENPWIVDHKIGGTEIYPASGMITMAIEGIRQLAGSKRKISGYRLENISFGKALPISTSGDGVETQLHFTRRTAASNKHFESQDFVVYAYLGQEWSSICEGTVIVEHDVEDRQLALEDLLDHKDVISSLDDDNDIKARNDTIHAKQFYRNLADYGFQFGATFQSLIAIHFNQNGQARGTIKLDAWKGKMKHGVMQQHVIHPTDLDGLGHVCIAAVSNGSWEPIPTMVPTRFKSLWISNSLLQRGNSSELDVCAKCTFRGYREADFLIVARGSDKKAQIIIEGWRETALDTYDPSSSPENAMHCYRIKWRPDPALLRSSMVAALIGKEESFTGSSSDTEHRSLDLIAMRFMLSVLDTRVIVRDQVVAHHRRYCDWICFQVETLDWEKIGMAPTRVNGLLGTNTSMNGILDNLAEGSAEGRLIKTCGNNLERILAGEVNAHELLFNQQLMSKVLHGSLLAVPYSRVAAYVDLLGHKKPHQRIIEIGAGDGAMTEVILASLASSDQETGGVTIRRFGHYAYTDWSPAFLEEVKERYQRFSECISYKTLSIDADPASQGFESESFDVVICRLFLYPSSKVETIVRNMRQLLKPGGNLVLVEPTKPDCLWLSFVFGLLPGWWSDVQDNQISGPVLSGADWHVLLTKVGFSSMDACLSDSWDNESCPFNAIISTAASTAANEISVSTSASQELETVIFISGNSAIQAKIAREITTSWQETVPTTCNIRTLQHIQTESLKDTMCIFLQDLETSFLRDMCNDDLTALKILTGSSKGVLWVTTGCGEHASRPDSALITGVGRNILSENWDTKFIELALEAESPVSRMVEHITRVFQDSLLLENGKWESEYMERNGQLCIGRVVPVNDLTQKISSKANKGTPQMQNFGEDPQRTLTLTIGTPGLLDTFYFEDDPIFGEPLAVDGVEIEVRATGMNFKDVMIALGQLAGNTLGYECAGIVRRSGPSAKFQRGDRVCCCTTTGAYKTFARAHASSVAKIPDHISFTAAAALPLVFCTAHYSLVRLACLQEGQSVLIHSGAGGVGQAAITIAKMLKATIYTTVGTEEKKRFLIDRYQIPENHIFSSRTPLFAKILMNITKGVDVILNSSSGEVLRATWSCIAPFGRFIELGKSDINSRNGLPMSPFDKNVTFASVDLGIVMDQAKGIMGSTLKAVMALFEDAGHQNLLSPVSVYKVSDLQKAFRRMQSGDNIGKVVVEMDGDAPVPVLASTKASYNLDSAATYVISGGLGGLGRSITRWMASRDARNFLLLSRTGTQRKDAAEFIQEMKDRGVNIQAPICDITSEAAVAKTFRDMAGAMPPIKGCIQASMVLKDGLFENTSLSDFNTVLRPKVHGSWNLHSVLPSELDFFLLLSSVSGVTGARAQAAYAAGNTFQNALARHRVSFGQKCISLDLGPVSSEGYAAETDLIPGLEAIGLQTVGKRQLFALLDHCCNPSLPVPTDPAKSQIITGLGGAETLPAERLQEIYWTRKPMFSILRQMNRCANAAAANSSSAQDGAQTFKYAHLLRSAPTQTVAQEVVTAALRRKVAQNLNMKEEDIDTEKPIHAYGIDSLVALEVRYWFAKEIKAEVTTWEVMQAASLGELAALAAGRSAWRRDLEGEKRGDKL
ncbi:MAG: hypothetical protein Q9225_003081 [Loekoesia sp. 1 TL-2023]